MLWKVVGVFFAIIFSVLAEEPANGEPYLRIMAKSRVYNVREQKAIYCKGMNLKEPIEWYDPAEKQVKARSSTNNRIFVERMRDEAAAKVLVPLIIQRAQLEDSGNWTCRSGDLSEAIDIVVGEKVKMDKEEDNYEGEEGNNAKLECEAKGSPKPSIQWYKDGTPIPEDRKKYGVYERGDKYTLEIKNVNHLDAGEYLCKFTQEQLTYFTGKRIQVNILHKPLMVDAITQEFFQEFSRTVEIYAILNETKNITCMATANPPPTFTWVKKRHDGFNEKINGIDMVYNSDDGGSSVLMLRMFNESFLGEYRCTASNKRGSTSTVFHVSLGNKPGPPDHVNLVNATVDTLSFNVTCDSCNFEKSTSMADKPDNLPILGYSFQLVPVVEGFDLPDWENENAVLIDTDIVSDNETVFDVGPLANKTKFYVRVRTRNAAGYSTWLDVEGTAETTDFAVKLISSFILVFTAVLFTRLG